MKISAIQRQVKRGNRYSIFIDGKYTLSLSDIGLLESKLSVGQELSDKDIRELRANAQTDNFYSRVLNYIAIRPRSEWEIKTYLNLKHCPTPLANSILNKLSNKGFINDEAFAKSWIENRRLLKPVSRRRLVSELRAKRISGEVIDKAIGEDQVDDTTALRELVNIKRRQTKYQDKLKLMQYLARQGFGYESIKEVLSED